MLLLLALSVTIGPVHAQRVRSVRPPVRLLWIGAHPDDEGLVAPIFGPACVEHGNDCAIIILTNSSAVRAAEAQRAAAALHARLIQWDLPDVLDVSLWGDRAALVARLASTIAAESPTRIYTFDPWHGSSCHPAHREAGRLTLDAVATLGANAPAVVLVETLIERDAQSRIVGFGPATPSASAIDATNSWHYLVDDAAIHESQFDAEQIALLRAVAPEERRVWVLPSNEPPGGIAGCP
ncbi:MAG: GlcNAc-PI de-N-acetylase [Thermoanaerobaculia bacterium]|nr:GlcNAc-PI de-N-acetylase [Thermoanaerobaculia bacterium]